MSTHTAVAESVSFQWNTPVGLEQLPLTAAGHETHHLDPEAEILLRDWIDGQLRKNGAPQQASSAQLRVATWSHGHSQPIGYGRGSWQGWSFLNAAPAETPDSGAISLLDPRAGSSAVFMPRLPWGRMITIRPFIGMTVLCPGWLGWTVLPVVHRTPITVVEISIE